MTEDLERQLRSAMEGATRTLVASPDLDAEVHTRARARARRAVRARAAGTAGLVAAVVGLFLAVAGDGDDARQVRTVTVPTTADVPAPEVAPSTTTPATVAPAPAVPPGALDPSFGTGGRVTTFFEDESGPRGSSANAVAVDGQGRLVAAGSVEWGDESAGVARRLVLARYLPDGALDASFGAGGKVVSSTRGKPSGLFVLADGALVVAGSGVDDDRDVVFLARFRADGSPDPTFGSLGRTTVACGATSCAAGRPVRQADGRLLVPRARVTGDDTSALEVLRFNADGRLDAGYGEGGMARLGAGGPAAITIDAEGRAVVAGTGPGGALVARLTPSGALDTSFGRGGKVGVDLDRETAGLSAVAVLADGRLVAAGFRGESDNSEIVLVRLQPDGQADPSFGSGGTVVTPRPSGRAYPGDLLVDPAGNAVIAGVDGEAMLVARYDAAGRLDRAFGDQGVVEVHFGGRTDGAYQVIRLPDGRLVVAGYAFSVEHNYGFGLAQLGG